MTVLIPFPIFMAKSCKKIFRKKSSVFPRFIFRIEWLRLECSLVYQCKAVKKRKLAEMPGVSLEL